MTYIQTLLNKLFGLNYICIVSKSLLVSTYKPLCMVKSATSQKPKEDDNLSHQCTIQIKSIKNL